MDLNTLIENIERDDVWVSAKHIYASILLKEHDSELVRKFIWDEFKKTGDYYYCSILKEDSNEDEHS